MPVAGSSDPLLWQLENSIFSEKARFALDYKAVPYRRKNLPPGLHGIILRLRGRGSTVPVLDIAGRKVRDSSAIIATLEELVPNPPLYPREEPARRQALALEEFFDEHCGHEVRRVGLDAILEDREALVGGMLADAPALMRVTARVGHPLVKRQIRRRYGINPESVHTARSKIEVAFDRIEADLGPSGYLIGDRFSVADLTAAALLAPLVLPAELPGADAAPSLMSPELRAFRELVADRVGFRWVMEIYRRHRTPEG
jgi:glutathione S-transferase